MLGCLIWFLSWPQYWLVHSAFHSVAMVSFDVSGYVALSGTIHLVFDMTVIWPPSQALQKTLVPQGDSLGWIKDKLITSQSINSQGSEVRGLNSVSHLRTLIIEDYGLVVFDCVKSSELVRLCKSTTQTRWIQQTDERPKQPLKYVHLETIDIN